MKNRYLNKDRDILVKLTYKDDEGNVVYRFPYVPMDYTISVDYSKNIIAVRDNNNTHFGVVFSFSYVGLTSINGIDCEGMKRTRIKRLLHNMFKEVPKWIYK